MCGQSVVPVLYFNGAVLGVMQQGRSLALKCAPLACLLRLPCAAALCGRQADRWVKVLATLKTACYSSRLTRCKQTQAGQQAKLGS